MIRKPKFMSTDVKKLRYDYKKACDAYLHRFCELIEMDRHYADWVDVGGIAEVGDYYVGMQDIITAVEGNVGYEQFIKWYDYTLKCGMSDLHHLNLEHWLQGCPRYTEEHFLKLEELRKKRDDAEQELQDLINSYKEEI